MGIGFSPYSFFFGYWVIFVFIIIHYGDGCHPLVRVTAPWLGYLYPGMGQLLTTQGHILGNIVGVQLDIVIGDGQLIEFWKSDSN